MKKIEELLETKEFTLGTHLPILRAVLDVFKPKGIMELGTGLKSTPFLYSYNSTLLSVESDLGWLKNVEPLVIPRDGFELIYHDIGHGVDVKTKYKQIPTGVVDECIKFYQELMKNHNLDFLFVDHVSGLRVTTIIELFGEFSVVAYHDAQHKGYFYDKLLEITLDDYLHVMFESLGVYTGILVHKDYSESMEMFDSSLKNYGEKYCNDFDVEYLHKLREIN